MSEAERSEEFLDELFTHLRDELDAPGTPRADDADLVAKMSARAATTPAAAAGFATGAKLLSVLILVGGVGGWLLLETGATEPTANSELVVEIPSANASPPAATDPPLRNSPAPGPAADAEPVGTLKQVEPAPRASPPEPKPRPSAAELLRLGNQHRRAGQTERAMSRYRELQRHYPKSREAAVATISRGRLELGVLGMPAEARHSFERYLRLHPNGSLAPEAMAGIARSWRALGNAARERNAWMELVERFPKSVYAATAKSRIETLAPEDADEN